MLSLFKKRPEIDVEQVAQQAAQQASAQTAAAVLRGLATAPEGVSFDAGYDGYEALLRRRQMQVSSAYGMNNPERFTDQADPRYRPYAQVDVDTLRLLAKGYDVLAACIAHLKDQVIRTGIRIVPKDDKDKSTATQKAIQEAEAFFDVHGGLGGVGTTRYSFEGRWLDDLITIGVYALYCDFKTRGDLALGNPDSITAIDASTIQPLISPYGFPPEEDAVVYRQIVQGSERARFTRKDLVYGGLPIFEQTTSPYPVSPVELVAIVVHTALKSDEWNRTWLTDGNAPNHYLEMPQEKSWVEVEKWLDLLDLMNSGNPAARHKVRLTPGPIHGATRKDSDFGEMNAELRDRTCSIMGVNPASIGHHSRQYKDSQEAAMDSTSDNRVAQILMLRAMLYTDVCRRKGWDFLKVIDATPDAEDAKVKADRFRILIESGQRSPNECRQEDGIDPFEGGDVRFISSSLVPIEQVVNGQGVSGQPADDGTPDEDTPDEDAVNAAFPELEEEEDADVTRDLKLWEKKAINRLKSGKQAACEFQSEVIPLGQAVAVFSSLQRCQNTKEVRHAFGLARAATGQGVPNEKGNTSYITVGGKRKRVHGAGTADEDTESEPAAKPRKARAGRKGRDYQVKRPVSAGHWEGEPGNGVWHSDKKAVRDFVGDAGITFKNDFPDFRPHMAKIKGRSGERNTYVSANVAQRYSLEFGFTGNRNADFAAADKVLARKLGFKTAKEVAEYRTANQLTWHHEPACTNPSMILVPFALHDAIPHSGGHSRCRA